MAKLGRLYVNALKIAIVICFAVLVVTAFYQVVSRYIFSVTPPWAEELARYLAIWVVFISSALAIELRGHIAVDAIPNLLPRTVRLAVNVFVWLCIFGFLLLFLRESMNMLTIASSRGGQVAPGLSQAIPGISVPFVWVYSILPLSGVLMLISSARAFWRFVQHEARGVPEEETFQAEI